MGLTYWFIRCKLAADGLIHINQYFYGKGGIHLVIYVMTEAEMQLAGIIWEHEPVGSGELVQLAREKLGWKKSTTYTVLRKICKNEIFRNENAIVSSRISREEYTGRKGERYVAENYNGSLPSFVAAFLKCKKLSKKDIEELAQIIEEYENEQGG